MNRLRLLVVVLGIVIAMLLALLAVLLIMRGQGAPLLTPATPAASDEGLPQRTVVGVVGIISGCGCLLLIGVALGVVFMWNRRRAVSLAPSPVPGQAAPLPGTPAARLAVVQGTANTRQLVLAGSAVLIGRGAECALVVDDPGVSVVHARLDPVAAGWLLTDAHSATGTYVNGKRILQHTLQPGDQIRLGKTLIEFQ